MLQGTMLAGSLRSRMKSINDARRAQPKDLREEWASTNWETWNAEKVKRERQGGKERAVELETQIRYVCRLVDLMNLCSFVPCAVSAGVTRGRLISLRSVFRN